MTKEQLAELRAAYAAATPGEWEAREFDFPETPFNRRRVYRVEIVSPIIQFGKRFASRLICQIIDFCEWTDHPANRDWIIKSHNAFPALLAHVEALEAEVKRLREKEDELLEVDDALSEAGYWGRVDVEVRSFAEAIQLMAQNLAERDRQLAAAREALTITRKDSRIAAVLVGQVEPSSAITVKESDRLNTASGMMRLVAETCDKAIAALEGGALLSESIGATAPKERRDVNPEFDCDAFTLKPLALGERADCESDGHYMCNYCKRFDRSSVA